MICWDRGTSRPAAWASCRRDSERSHRTPISDTSTAAGEVSEIGVRSEEHTSELQSRGHIVCRLLLEKKNRMALKLHPASRAIKQQPTATFFLSTTPIRISLHSAVDRPVLHSFPTRRSSDLGPRPGHRVGAIRSVLTARQSRIPLPQRERYPRLA